MTYNSFIFLVGAISTGALIWLIGDSIRKITKSNLALFSWEGFTDTVSAIFQAIGLKRERRRSIESFIQEMTDVSTSLGQFQVKHKDPRQLEGAFNETTMSDARKYAGQIYHQLGQMQSALSQIEQTVWQATSVAASQLDLPAMATSFGATVTKAPAALPAGQPQAVPATSANPQPTRPSWPGFRPVAPQAPTPPTEPMINVEVEDEKVYVITDFKKQAPNNQFEILGKYLKGYITDNNLVIGKTIMFYPKEILSRGASSQPPAAKNSSF